jgi:PAS domain S-box-containing protein
VFETTDAFVQVIDTNYNFLAINKANADEYERVFGLRPQVGDNLLDLLASHDEAEIVEAAWARALAGEAFTTTTSFGDPARGQRWYEIKFSPLRNPSGQLIGASHFSYDVTERRHEQERLRETEEALRKVRSSRRWAARHCWSMTKSWFA